MSRLTVPRFIATSAVMTAATTVRIGVGVIGLWTRRTPQIVRLAVGTLNGGGKGRPEAELRDELIALFRDSAETSWLELRRGVDDFDLATRRDDDAREPSRPYRVKP